MASKTSYLLVTLLTAACVACGGDDGAITLPVDGDKTISELSKSEREEICTVGVEVMQRDLGGTICAMMGLVAELQGETSCEAQQEVCLDEQFGDIDCSQADAAETIACEVTVAEWEQCMNDALRMINKLLPRVTCSTSLEELVERYGNLDPESFDFAPPESCQAIEQQCPGIDLGVDTAGASMF
jgi:hypothetical protein